MEDLDAKGRRNLLRGAAIAAMGSPLIGNTQQGATPTSSETSMSTFQRNAKTLTESLNAWEYLTVAQIEEVRAYTFSTDMTLALQAAMDAARLGSKRLYIPAGGYKVTTLTVAADLTERERILQIEGDGFGEFFYLEEDAGTILKGAANAPIFISLAGATPASGGTLRISNLVFIGNSTTPVVHLETFYGICEFSYNLLRQNGVGNGLQIDYCATAEIHNSWFFNRDIVTFGLGATRVGIGVYIAQNYDAGLATIRKCTVRGWLTGIQFGVQKSSKYMYSGAIYDTESSCTYNGFILTSNARATTVSGNYLEGGEGGVGIADDGDYNKVINNFTFPGFSTHLKSTSFTYGNVYIGNTFAAGTKSSQVLIDIASSSVSGGPGKVASMNHLSFGGSGGDIPGVVGLRINGVDPRLDLSSNSFYPRGNWVGGAGTQKVDNLATNGVFGLTQVFSGDLEMPMLSRGAISLEMAGTLTEANVISNILTLPAGSFFTCTAKGETTVNRLTGTDGSTAGRVLIFRTTNKNMTFASSAYNSLCGPFTGPGTLTLICNRIGADTFAYEIARTVFR
jgi:hypothetical protein